MTEIAGALLWAAWAALWLFVGFVSGLGYCRKRAPKCIHWWEIVSEPWVTREYRRYNDISRSDRTYWRERCTACGLLRTTGVWGAWTLQQITGEKTYGTAQTAPGVR